MVVLCQVTNKNYFIVCNFFCVSPVEEWHLGTTGRGCIFLGDGREMGGNLGEMSVICCNF